MDPGIANEGHDRRQWREFERRAAGTSGNHPDLLTIAAFVDRRLADDEREAVETHVAGCADCAAMVSEAHELIAAAEATPTLVPRHVLAAARRLVAGRQVGPGQVWRNTAWWSAAAIITISVGFGGYRAGHSTLPQAEIDDRVSEALSFTLDQTDTLDLESVLLDLPSSEGSR